MANEKADSPRAFLIYETTLQQLKKYCTSAQAGEFLFLMGEYMLEGRTDVESKDPMVDVILQMNKPVLDAAEKRHRQAVENGKKGAEHGKKGGRPKKDSQSPKENPQTPPDAPEDNP